jgi:very-short-patch-repair endonuclease
MSKGELEVANFLKENGIRFYYEFYFKEFSIRGRPALFFYDFYIPKYNVCIEFDGKQHYTRKWKGMKIDCERSDFLKTAFCLKKGIKLLRIKYTDIDKVGNKVCDFFDKHFPV